MDVKVPTKQDVQTEADAAEYFPATQLPVTEESPVLEQYEPAVQALHALNPAEAAKDPARQEEQMIAETAEYFPAAQLPVAADNPVIAQ